MGKGCFATAWAVPCFPKSYACSVRLRDAMCPSGNLLHPSLPAGLPHCLHPSMPRSRRARARGLSVLHSNSPATSTAHFHDSITVRRESFAEDVMPGKSLEVVYLEKIPF